MNVFVAGLILGLLIAGNVLAVLIVLWRTSATSSTNTSLVSTTVTNKSSTTTTATTTTAPPSSACVYNTSITFYNDQFLYSPTSQTYAAGMLNNQFGVFKAYSYGNVTAQAIWTANQTSTSVPCFLALQTDRNLVVYATRNQTVLWAANIYNNGTGKPFCFKISDSGNLIWTDNSNSIVWQTNTAQTG
ncbi:unnamed protein product [Adineta ricciae]|uniref:Bulb-type lectin domain-containing protein n=1 Tax=Adineta ricciae TaxID=249248 RepID=A0A815JE64_ADIRI|nr:unnamed protein product [Adineta ricciae]CAF1378301.1 unnamed protein product [Adineta ricciae]